MRDRTAAGHAQRPADEHVAHLNVHLARDQRIVRQDDFARAGFLGKVLQIEIELAVEAVAPSQLPWMLRELNRLGASFHRMSHKSPGGLAQTPAMT